MTRIAFWVGVAVAGLVLVGCKKDPPAASVDAGAVAASASIAAVPVSAAAKPSAAPSGGPAASGSAHSGSGGSNGGGGSGSHAGVDSNVAGAFGAACSSDAECKTGGCAHGGRGSFCSFKCTKDSDCPEPPTGGRCKESGLCNR